MPTSLMPPFPGFKEVAQFGQGKSFGEIALINHKPKNVTIRCLMGTHFATLDKHNYNLCLARIERKRLENITNFMFEIPCFHHWSKDCIIKFSYYLKKQKFKRNQHLYKMGEPADKIYIIKKGVIELFRKSAKEFWPVVSEVLQIFGKHPPTESVLKQKLGDEIKDLPRFQSYMMAEWGSMIGEEDVISEG